MQLPDYPVSAWHFPAELLEIPAPVIRLDSALIAESAAASLPELLQQEAHLHFRSFSGQLVQGEVDQRGFGENSGLRTLVLVDGQVLNPADMSGLDWSQLPLDAVESVEVIQGGQNVLYGDRALAGVIKIETRRPLGTEAELRGAGGSFGFAQGAGNLGYGADRWAIRAGVSGQRTEGYREDAAYWSRHGYVSFEAYLPPVDRLNLRLSVSESDQVFPGPLIWEQFQANPCQSTQPGGDGFSRLEGAILTFRAEGQRAWGHWQLTGGYDQQDVAWGFGATDPERSNLFGQNDQRGWSLRPRLQWGNPTDAESPRLIVGLDGVEDRLDFTLYRDAANTISPSDTRLQVQSLSPYALLEWPLNAAWTLSGGTRLEWHHYRIDHRGYVETQLEPFIATNRGGRQPNPDYQSPPDRDPALSYAETLQDVGTAAEFSLNYQGSTHWSAYAGYDRVYRFPTTDERADYQGHGSTRSTGSALNRDLEPESGHQIELGYKYLGSRHDLRLTAFWLHMDNEIAFEPDPAPGQNTNLGPVRRVGLEASWGYRAEHWGLSTRFTLIHAEQLSGPGEGHQVPLVPPLRSSNQLWWKPVGPLRLTLSHRYVAAQNQGGDLSNSARKIPAYHLLGARLDGELSDTVLLFIKGDNLTNQRYAQSAFAGSFYPGEGRSWSFGAKLNF